MPFSLIDSFNTLGAFCCVVFLIYWASMKRGDFAIGSKMLNYICSLNWFIPWDRSAPLTLHSFGPAGSWFNPMRSISLSRLLNLVGLNVAEIRFLSGNILLQAFVKNVGFTNNFQSHLNN